MTTWIIRTIHRYKESDNIFIRTIRIIYSFSKDWISGLINLISGAFIPNVYLSDKPICGKIIFTVALILVNYYFHLVREYKIKEYMYRRLSSDIIHSCTIITEALADYTLENVSGKGHFQYASRLVCDELYAYLKQCFKCEFRISVVQQFAAKDDTSSQYCKMIARRSKNKLKNTNFKEHKIPSQKDTYYFVELFQKDGLTFVCLVDDKEIAKQDFYYQSKKHSKIQQYIALLENAYSDKVAFILQIDCMAKGKLGQNSEEVEDFASRYLSPYVSILNNAYQHERVLSSN